MKSKQNNKLTIEDGKRALKDHVREKALEIKAKYGSDIDYEKLLDLIQDPDVARFPVSIEFDSSYVESGTFAKTIKNEDSASKGYTIYLHEYFKDNKDVVPSLVLYHLVVINYGDFATYEEAEIFGATLLGIEVDEYYNLLCNLTDCISN